MLRALAVVAALALCACEKKIAAEAEPPRPAESVPISNNPAHGAAMIGATRAAADKVDAANEARSFEANAGE